jgi:hypothetical protein
LNWSTKLEIPAKTEVTMDRDALQTNSFVGVLKCAWPALLLATVCLLPYLNKAFINDDPWFLTMAQQIVEHPMHPPEFDICWILPDGCWKVTPENALMGEEAQGYVLVPTVLGGAHEWIAHLTQLVFVWIAIVAMASLVLRFGWDRRHAIVGALLLVAIAPFMPMASTAMPDMLATALAVVAMERLAAWKAEQRWSQGAAAAFALGLAGFARPHLVLLLPLAAIFLLESANPKEAMAQLRRRFWLWTPVFAGCGLLLAVIVMTREHSPALNPLVPLVGLHNVSSNLPSYLLYLVFPMPLGACWLANRLKSRSLRAAILLIVAEGIAWFGHLGPRRVTLLVAVGLAALVDLLWEAWDRAEHDRLTLMLWILIPLPTAYYIQLPAKYLLPCMPAIILLCFRLMEGFSLRFSRAAAVALIVASTGYSLLILHTDAEFADFGRDAMYQLIQPHVAAGERVWIDGQYSSYWYAPLAGATETLPGGPQPKAGDLLVVGQSELGEGLVLPRFPHRTLVDAVTHKYSFGRTWGNGIGLYSNLAGYWLWGLGDSPDDEYELWRID